MPIERTAPNGVVIEFPDGTEENQINQYLALPEYQPDKQTLEDGSDRGLISDIPLQVLGGARDAVQSTLGFVEGLSDTLGEATGIGGFNLGSRAKNGFFEYKSHAEMVKDGDSNFLFGKMGVKDAYQLPEIDQADTITGGLIRGVSQFATGWITGGKLVKGATSLASTSTAIKLTKSAISNPIKTSLAKGALADTLAFDENVGRFSDVINQFAPSLSNPLTDYLASDPEDGFWEGRFKNAVEGLALGGAVEGIFRTARYIKNKKQSLNGEPHNAETLKADEEYITIYHGTNSNFKEFNVNKTADNSIWFTTNRKAIEDGSVGASSQGRIIERTINENELKLATREQSDKLLDDQLIQEGYDGIKFDDIGDETGVYYRIFNPQKLLKNNPNLKPEIDKLNPTKVKGNQADEGAFPERKKKPKYSVEELAENDLSDKIFNNFQKLQRSVDADGKPIKGDEFKQRLSVEEGLDLGINTKTFLELNKDGLFTLKTIAKANARALTRLKRVKADAIVERLAERKYGGNIAKLYDDFGKFADNLEETDSLIVAHEVMHQTVVNLIPKLSRDFKAGLNGVTLKDIEVAMHMAEGGWFNTARVQQGLGRGLRQIGRVKGNLETFKTAHTSDAVQNIMNEWRTFGGNFEDMVDKIAKADDPNATSKILAFATKNRTWNIANEYWINALLSNPKTHVVNISSNLINTFLRPLEVMVGSRIRFLESAEQYAKIKSQGEDAFLVLSGLTKYLDDVVGYTKLSFKNSDGVLTNTSKLDVPTRSIGGVAGEVINTPTRFLNAEDEFFKQINYRARLYQISMRKALADGASKDKIVGSNIKNKKPITELEAKVAEYFRQGFDESGVAGIDPDALRYAEEQTFTQDLFGIFQKIQTMTNDHPFLRQIIPFVKTPVNLMMAVVDRTPLGLVRKQFRDDFMGRSGDLFRTAQVRGQLATGMALITYANILASSGNITGATALADEAPLNSRNLKDLKRSIGFQPYSFRYYDDEEGKWKYTSYGRFDPFGTFFGLVADFHTYHKKMTEDELAKIGNSMLLTLARQGEDVSSNLSTSTKVQNYVGAGYQAITKNLLSKTYLKGLTENLQVMTGDDPRKLQRMVNSKFGSFIPSLFTKLVNDPFYRDARNLLDEVKKRTGTGEAQKKYDFRGNAYQQQGSEGERLFRNVFNPFTNSEQVIDPVADEILRLGVNVAPAKSIYNGSIDLTLFKNKSGTNAYDKLNEILNKTKLGGYTLDESIKNLMNMDYYKNTLSDPIIVDENIKDAGGKAKEIKKIIKRYHQQAEIQLLGEMNNFTSTKDKTNKFTLRMSNFKANQNKQNIKMGIKINQRDIDGIYNF